MVDHARVTVITFTSPRSTKGNSIRMGGPIGYTNAQSVDITEKGYTGHMRSDTPKYTPMLHTRPDGHTRIGEK